jgi:hypothetical protein
MGCLVLKENGVQQQQMSLEWREKCKAIFRNTEEVSASSKHYWLILIAILSDSIFSMS